MEDVVKTKAIALVVIILLVAGVASAQSTEPINFRTPFAFVAGDQAMPAGEYRVSVVSPTGILSFRSGDGNVSVLVSSQSKQGEETADRFRLVFHRYGVHYYISEIWAPGYKTGRAVQARAAEIELARKEKPEHVTLYADTIGQ
jgi:hypothetical protein